MEIRQLRNFIQIADLGSLSSAAKTLYIAQPALSQQIAQLESELGQPLLVRRSTGVRLTEQGTVFYQRAQRILKELVDLGSAVQEVASKPVGRVAVGLPLSTAIQFAMPLLAVLPEKYPAVQVEFFDEMNSRLLQGLVSGRFDIAVLVDDAQAALVHTEPLLEETLYLVSRPDIAPKAKTVALGKLDQYPLTLPGRGHGVRDVVEEAVRAAGSVLPEPRVVANSMNIMRQSALAGLAHAIMPWGALSDELRSGALKATPTEPPLTRRAYLSVAREALLTVAAQAVMGVVRETTRNRVKSGEWQGVRLLD